MPQHYTSPLCVWNVGCCCVAWTLNGTLCTVCLLFWVTKHEMTSNRQDGDYIEIYRVRCVWLPPMGVGCPFPLFGMGGLLAPLLGGLSPLFGDGLGRVVCHIGGTSSWACPVSFRIYIFHNQEMQFYLIFRYFSALVPTGESLHRRFLSAELERF